MKSLNLQVTTFCPSSLLSTSTSSKPTTSFLLMCSFSSRDWRSTQSLIVNVPNMYPLVYSAKVFCLNLIHKYIIRRPNMTGSSHQSYQIVVMFRFGLRLCPQARFFNHKIIKSYLSRPKKGMIGDLAGVSETIIFL